MMYKWQRFAAIGCICASAFFLTGCWDYQKINDRAQIIGIAIDPVENQESEFDYTLQSPVYTIGRDGGGTSGEAGKSSGQGASMKQFRNFYVRARGVSEAMTKAQMQYDKMLYLGNLQTIVLNSKLNYVQIRRAVTEMTRIPSLDRLAWVTFSEDSARQIFEKDAGGAPADSIDRVYGSTLKQHGYSVRMRLWEYWRDMNGVGIAPHAGFIKTTKDGLQIYGVICEASPDARVELSTKDAVYYNFIQGGIQRMTLWVPYQTEQGQQPFELGAIQSTGKIAAVLKGKRPTLLVRIHTKAIVHQDDSADTRVLTSADMQQYQSAAEQHIRSNAIRVLKQCQAQGADPFGFGAYLMMHQPTTYQLVARQWQDLFKRAAVDLQVHVSLTQKGSLM